MRQTVVVLLDWRLLRSVQLLEKHRAAFVRCNTFAASQDESRTEVLDVNSVNKLCYLELKQRAMVFWSSRGRL